MLSQLSNLRTFRDLFTPLSVLNKVRGYPLAVNILLSSGCNLNCGICSAKKILHSKNELKTGDWNALIDEIAEFRPAVFFGGGEPFLRDDIFELFGRVKDRKMRCGVVTNGLLLDQKNSSRLLKVMPEVIIFSLHGSEKNHDRTVGSNGAFRLLLENIRRIAAQKKGTKLILNCVIGADNYLELEQIAELGRELGVDTVRFEHLIFLTPSEYERHLSLCREILPGENCGLATYIRDSAGKDIGVKLKQTIVDLHRRFGGFVLFKPYLDDRELERWYMPGFDNRRSCMFVKNSLFIMPNGDIVPCQFFDGFVLGNVTEDRFLTVWNSKRRRDFSRLLSGQLLPGCMRCCKL